MARLFGTDGVRGLANRDLTVDLALNLARCGADVLGRSARAEGRRPTAVLGRDPRVSGEFLGSAVAAGLASAGVDVMDAGVLPTPATAFLVGDLGADFGVMISASHNPAEDNGIKFFARGGLKLDDAIEDEIAAALDGPKLAPTGSDVGRIRRFADAEDRYLVHLLGTLPNRLDGIRMVLDCANGAASAVSPQVFTDAGADVTVIGAEPDGYNINAGVGSTHIERLQNLVRARGADVGIAHDGDADRCLAVDENGRVIDGDQIMAILALALQGRGELAQDTLVCTVMSNLGLKLAMRKAGIQIAETKVGDRYVLEEINAHGYSLGGEQSGHVIMRRFATTGDGLLTGLQLLAALRASGVPLSVLADRAMTRLPQTLINVRVVDKHRLEGNQPIADAVHEAQAALGDTGRVLLRPSGTEPLIRVMVEAADTGTSQTWATRLAGVVETALA
ncbi:MAG: phosphoglucosamine mutase [Microbacteriaceae bacterium]|jgi:phosphoglucosamine mutase|nr:phosphoglucosamine mutase [Microbacteriaceae bacterium]